LAEVPKSCFNSSTNVKNTGIHCIRCYYPFSDININKTRTLDNYLRESLENSETVIQKQQKVFLFVCLFFFFY
jgi:hypothetical protein